MKNLLLSAVLAATLFGADHGHLGHDHGAHEEPAFDLSLVVDASYVDRNIKDAEIGHFELPAIAHGLIGPSAHEGHDHDGMNTENGFNFNYGELQVNYAPEGNMDFTGILHITEGNVEVENAFVTANLAKGLTVRGGKFFSGFGINNPKHHHAWHFADAPLVHAGFFGSHGINEIGLQLQYEPVVDTLIGFELLQGTNDQMFGNDAINDDANSTLVSEDKQAPSLIVAYAKTSQSIGKAIVDAGVTYMDGSSRINHLDDEEEAHAFYGDSKVYGVDLALTYPLGGGKSLLWENEWFQREMDGNKYVLSSGARPAVKKEQAAYYSQLIYTLNRDWRFGLRYDDITQNDVNGAEQEAGDRMSGMVQYRINNDAFVRLQYNNNRALYEEDEGQKDVKTLIVQFNYTIGSHAGHNH
ncbi:MAG: hypothetical protein R3302_01480 [Sulfurimonadaceae bacterium]|nr:hypothetical protein [Sulfurimonadaceae bacterium]